MITVARFDTKRQVIRRDRTMARTHLGESDLGVVPDMTELILNSNFTVRKCSSCQRTQ